MASAAPPTRTPAPRQDTFVERQLRSTRGRIVFRDVVTAALVLALVTLVYGVTMVVLDVNLDLPGWARQISLFGFLAAAGAFAYFAVVRPLIRPVNPFFAAKQVEQTIPDAKNSVINWLDLHDQPLPESTLAALGVRAAKSLKKADLNEAVPQRSVAWLGGAVAAVAVVALIVLVKLGGMQLGSLISRAFAPFTPTPIAAQTRLEVVEPAGGNLTISLNRLNQTASSVQFTVHAEGRIPESDQPDA